MPGLTNKDADPSLSPMPGLKVHNDLIGDQAALDKAWNQDGYWFFKNVLDKDAVARLRKVYVEELDKLGVVDMERLSDDKIYYNGNALDSFPYRMEPLAQRSPWGKFVGEPAINAFFTKLLQDDPFWVPVVEYRATPPVAESAKVQSRFDGIHQDGPFSPGIPFRICWIPLVTIDEEIGGLCLAEGLTEEINRHPVVNGSNTMIPTSDIPKEKWRRGDYEAGDVLLLNYWTPHSGLKNLSSRFRLSMDHRIMAAKSDKCPLLGTIKFLTEDHVTLVTKSGERNLRIDDNTYVRSNMGKRLFGKDMWTFYKPGTPAIVAFEDDLAVAIRSQQG